ncbi:MAG: glycosyltransferase family 2 protein [Patescibacteria group bacterium]|jgi:hypothetical protein
MDLSIIIVNWNTKQLLSQCLASIYQNTNRTKLNFEVIVVDNGSTDDSLAMVKKDYRQVMLISNPQNAGYVFANNQGIKLARGKFILLLNSDTQIFSMSLEKTVEYLKANPKVGIAGCTLLNLDGGLQYSVRHFPRLTDQIVILTKMHNFFPGLISHYIWRDFNYKKEQAVDQVMGAFMIIRREVIDQIGPLDEKIWSWFEDVDYCRRARQAGWEVKYAPVAQIIHHKGESFSQHSAFRKQKMFVKSLLYYFKKHNGKTSYYILWPFAAWSLFLAWWIQLFSIKKKNQQL